MKKVLILGANGMAGHVLTMGLRSESTKFQVLAVARNLGKINADVLMDVSNFEKLEALVKDNNFDTVINCIGLLNEIAENHIDQAILLNSYLPQFLAEITKDTKTKIIHISTDCVFSGDRGGYLELDFRDGRGYYAQTKALGEIINDKDLTIRTSIIGPELKNNGVGLFDWFAKQEGEIHGYTEAYWSGVTTIELMKGTKEAIEQDLSGLYHMVYSNKISKHDLIKEFAKSFDKSDLQIHKNNKYKIDKSLINTRTDFNYSVPGYKVMISEMKDWMQQNRSMYSHYEYLLSK